MLTTISVLLAVMLTYTAYQAFRPEREDRLVRVTASKQNKMRTRR